MPSPRSLASAAVLSMAVHVGTSTTVNFDDLKPQPPHYAPVFDPPAPYQGLEFTAFSVFDPQSKPLEDFILPEDRNCAVSRPNALIGSRLMGEDGIKPSIGVPSELSNDTCFDLLSFQVKPMAAPPGNEEIRVWVQGYKNTSGETDDKLLWHVDFPVGYTLNFLAEMPGSWRELQKVEIWAQYGPGRLDWEFCIDDVELRLRKQPEAARQQLEL